MVSGVIMMKSPVDTGTALHAVERGNDRDLPEEVFNSVGEIPHL